VNLILLLALDEMLLLLLYERGKLPFPVNKPRDASESAPQASGLAVYVDPFYKIGLRGPVSQGQAQAQAQQQGGCRPPACLAGDPYRNRWSVGWRVRHKKLKRLAPAALLWDRRPPSSPAKLCGRRGTWWPQPQPQPQPAARARVAASQAPGRYELLSLAHGGWMAGWRLVLCWISRQQPGVGGSHQQPEA